MYHTVNSLYDAIVGVLTKKPNEILRLKPLIKCSMTQEPV